jgi:hypothetical protein
MAASEQDSQQNGEQNHDQQNTRSFTPRGERVARAAGAAASAGQTPGIRQGELPPRPHRHVHWAWPLGLAVAGLGGAAAFILRGCWHTSMSWPTRHDEEFSYQVCTSCGIKRLYDQKTFHAYGPYGYDLHELIARERAARLRRLQKHEGAMRKSS